jgi:hypothetical protein
MKSKHFTTDNGIYVRLARLGYHRGPGHYLVANAVSRSNNALLGHILNERTHHRAAVTDFEVRNISDRFLLLELFDLRNSNLTE